MLIKASLYAGEELINRNMWTQIQITAVWLLNITDPILFFFFQWLRVSRFSYCFPSSFWFSVNVQTNAYRKPYFHWKTCYHGFWTWCQEHEEHKGEQALQRELTGTVSKPSLRSIRGHIIILSMCGSVGRWLFIQTHVQIETPPTIVTSHVFIYSDPHIKHHSERWLKTKIKWWL